MYRRRATFVNYNVGKSGDTSETKCALIIERNEKVVEKLMGCYRVPIVRHESSIRRRELYEANGYCLTYLEQRSNHEFGGVICL